MAYSRFSAINFISPQRSNAEQNPLVRTFIIGSLFSDEWPNPNPNPNRNPILTPTLTPTLTLTLTLTGTLTLTPTLTFTLTLTQVTLYIILTRQFSSPVHNTSNNTFILLSTSPTRKLEALRFIHGYFPVFGSCARRAHDNLYQAKLQLQRIKLHMHIELVNLKAKDTSQRKSISDIHMISSYITADWSNIE